MAPIHEASEAGDLVEVKRLVEEEGVNPEEPISDEGRAPLYHAARKGRDDVVTYLLDTCGVTVDSVDDRNFTALNGAACQHQVSCIRLLLQHGADPNIFDSSDGDTPLMTSAFYGHITAMTLLLEDGRCDLEMKRPDTGSTAILLATKRRNWDCVELLLSYHASPVAVNKLGEQLYRIAKGRKAPPHTLELIAAAIAEPDRARLLYRVRRINEAQSNYPTDAQRRLSRVELTFPGTGNAEEEEEEEQKVRRAVVQFVVGMKEDGSVGGGMLNEHVVELMDMMLPVWYAERRL